jgi:hypothetical protein
VDDARIFGKIGELGNEYLTKINRNIEKLK